MAGLIRTGALVENYLLGTQVVHALQRVSLTSQAAGN
jgi:hypothetical protein